MQLLCYEKILVPAHTPIISGTKENVTVTANTPNQSQIEKLSNAAEKGDPAYLENFRGPAYVEFASEKVRQRKLPSPSFWCSR